MTTLPLRDHCKAALLLENVSKNYDDERTLLSSVSLRVLMGESIAILGPSGSGKSTILQIMGGLTKPDSGHVWVDGMKCASQSQWDRLRRSKLGHVFQDSWLIPSLTAAQNIELPMMGTERSARVRRDRVQALLGLLSLANRGQVRAANLSGGERQRVALGRAIVNRPQIILADEPTGNLDARNTELVVDILHQLCDSESVALVMATHDLEAAKSCSKKLMIVGGGLQVVDGNQ